MSPGKSGPQPLLTTVMSPEMVTRPSPLQATSRSVPATSRSGMDMPLVDVISLSVPSHSQTVLSGSMTALKLQMQPVIPEVKGKRISRVSPAARSTVWSENVRPQSEVSLTTTPAAAAQPLLVTVTSVPVRLPSDTQVMEVATASTVRLGMTTVLSLHRVLSVPSLSHMVPL